MENHSLFCLRSPLMTESFTGYKVWLCPLWSTACIWFMTEVLFSRDFNHDFLMVSAPILQGMASTPGFADRCLKLKSNTKVPVSLVAASAAVGRIPRSPASAPLGPTTLASWGSCPGPCRCRMCFQLPSQQSRQLSVAQETPGPHFCSAWGCEGFRQGWPASPSAGG